MKEETISNAYGLHVSVYKQINGNDHIVSFRGTENSSLSAAGKDWVNNFNEGWPQYIENMAKISNLIDRLAKPGESAQIHLVGHSLGGALAQFTAYDFATRHNKELNHRITLTTWNGLGGEWGLKSNRQYNANQMDGIQAIHYYRTDDIVAKLGGAHVGGKTVALIPPSMKFASIEEAHSIEALRESLDKDFTREQKPNYHHFTKTSRKFLGTILAGLWNAADAEIEGNGLEELLRINSPFTLHKTGLAIVETTIFLATISAERLVNNPNLAMDAASHALGSIINISKNQPIVLNLLGLTITNTILDLARGKLSSHSRQLGRLLIEYGNQLKQAGSSAGERMLLIGEILNQSDNPDLSRIPLEWLMPDAALEPHGPGLLPLLEELQERMRRAEEARPLRCPLIVDLTGDGIETLTLDAEVYFDHDGNGFAELTGWVAPDDGLLAWDRNGNGRIDSGAELFGNHSVGLNGERAAHGFEALAALDGNQDGVIDAQDMAWHKLGVWQDRNSNAELDAGEWLTMEGAGIRQLNLQFETSEAIDLQGNQHRQLGSFSHTLGEERAMNDVWFRFDAARRIDLNAMEVDPQIQLLPNIDAIGNVASLHQAMQRDTSGTLRRMVEQWQRSSIEQQNNLINSLIFHWTGVQDQPINTQPWLSDARILAALESFLGITFRGGEGIGNWQMAAEIDEIFADLSLEVSKLLNNQGIRDPFLQRMNPQWNRERQQIDWQVSSSLTYLLDPSAERTNPDHLRWLQSSLVEMGDEGKRILSTIRSQLISDGGHLLKKLAPLFTSHSVISDSTDSVTYSNSQNSFLLGQQGSDILQAGHGDDILDGGEGNDQLHGSWGSDIYLLGQNFGKDIIHEIPHNESNNLVLFTSHAASDITAIECLDGNLAVRFTSDDQLMINNYFTNIRWTNTDWQTPAAINAFHFRDGSSWSHADILRKVVISGATETADDLGGYKDIIHVIDGLGGDDFLYGGNLNDLLNGNTGNDNLFGFEGDDRLIGGEGDDRLWGGRGNDILYGGAGNNQFMFSFGDGHDTIHADQAFTTTFRSTAVVFTDEITPQQVTYRRFGSNLQLSLNNGNDSLTIREFFRDNNPLNTWNPVLGIYFMSNGSLVRADQVPARISNMIQGSSAANTLTGTAGDDYIIGLGGNDILDGRDGNDFLDGGAGIDTATYAASRGAVRVDLSISTAQDIGLSGWDTLIAIENLTGSAWDDVLLGNGSANGIDGGAGDDWIDGGGGDDTLRGGSNGTGGDTVAYDSAVSGVTVSLALTTAQATGGAGRDTISAFENLRGSRFNDVLTGSASANRIEGGDGNDILWGSAGRDHHNGGAGADQFLYRSAAEAGNGLSGGDVISDFAAIDRIDLSRIDANSSRSGDQAFVWIGGAAFSAPGQLRYSVTSGNGLLEGNISGSSDAEFQIEILGGFALQPGIHVVL